LFKHFIAHNKANNGHYTAKVQRAAKGDVQPPL